MTTHRERRPEKEDRPELHEGDAVIYRHEGTWKKGFIVSTPDVGTKEKKLSFKIAQNRVGARLEGEAEVELAAWPRKVTFPEAGIITWQKKEYLVNDFVPDKSGHPQFVLQDIGTGAEAGYINESELDLAEKTGTARTAVEAVVRYEAEITALLAQVGEIKVQKRQELLKNLRDAEDAVKKIKAESSKDASEADKEKIATLTDEAERLQREIPQAIQKLEDEIRKLLEEQEGAKETEAKKAVAQSFANWREERVVNLDADVMTLKGAWDSKKKKYDTLAARVKELEAKQGGGAGGGKKKGGGAAPAAPTLTQAETDELARLKDQLTNDPLGPDPSLKKPSQEPGKPEELWMQTFEEIKTAAGSEAQAKKLFEEIEKRRQDQAKAARVSGGDYPAGNPGGSDDDKKARQEFVRETAKFTEAVIKDWKEAQPAAETFDYNAEMTSLRDRAEALHTQAKAAPHGKDVAKKLHELLKGALLAREWKRKTGDDRLKNVADTEKVLENLERELVAAKVKAEAAAAAAEKPSALEKLKEEITLPPELVVEMLSAHETEAFGVVEALCRSALVDPPDKKKLGEALKKFFMVVKPDTAMRDRLRESGIVEWKKFATELDDEALEKIAGPFLVMADADIRFWRTQQINTIRGLDETSLKDWLTDPKRVLKEWWEKNTTYSTLGQMRGKVLARSLINLGAIAGTTALTNLFLIPILPVVSSPARGAIVGAAAGAVKGAFQRLFGRDVSGFPQAGKKAADAAAKAKDELIVNELIAKFFTTVKRDKAGAVKGASGLNKSKVRELAHLLSTSLRRATQKDTPEELTIGEGDGKIVLKGIEILVYHQALEEAREKGTLGPEEDAHLKYARAIAAVRENQIKVKEPTEWVLDKAKKAISIYGGWVDSGKASLQKTVFVSTTAGSSIGLALNWAGGAGAPGGLAGGIGFVSGYGAEVDREKASAALEARKQLTRLTELVDEARQRAKTDRSAANAQAVADLYIFLVGLEKNAPPSQEMLEHANPDIKKVVAYIAKHALDVGLSLQKDESVKTLFESTKNAIENSGLLELAKITKMLSRVSEENDRREKYAKNHWTVTAVREWNRWKSGIIRGAVMGGIGYVLGAGFRAVKEAYYGAPVPEHPVAPPAETTSTPVAETPRVAVAAPTAIEAAGAPAAALAEPDISAAPSVEFPADSAVMKGDGITQVLARQLEYKFTDALEHNPKLSVTLEDGRTLAYIGGDVQQFAIKVAKEMAIAHGDLNMATGEETRLEYMGAGKGHVPVTEVDGKLTYAIKNEETYAYAPGEESAPRVARGTSLAVETSEEPKAGGESSLRSLLEEAKSTPSSGAGTEEPAVGSLEAMLRTAKAEAAARAASAPPTPVSTGEAAGATRATLAGGGGASGAGGETKAVPPGALPEAPKSTSPIPTSEAGGGAPKGAPTAEALPAPSGAEEVGSEWSDETAKPAAKAASAKPERAEEALEAQKAPVEAKPETAKTVPSGAEEALALPTSEKPITLSAPTPGTDAYTMRFWDAKREALSDLVKISTKYAPELTDEGRKLALQLPGDEENTWGHLELQTVGGEGRVPVWVAENYQGKLGAKASFLVKSDGSVELQEQSKPTIAGAP